MDKQRQKLIREFWDRSSILNLNNKDYYSYVKNLINEKLKEDIGNGDITTDALIDVDKEINAHIVAREDGIAAGIGEISSMFKAVKPIKKDGDKIRDGEIIVEISNNARKILTSERLILNILQRMSGIATSTYNAVKLANNECFIAGTRKTLLPLLDKKAISIGGALTHRLNLNDAAIIKDSHLEVLNNGIEKAIRVVIEKTKTNYIEIEVKNEEEALKAADSISNLNSGKLFAIMFDNMKATMIKNTIDKIYNIKKFKNDEKLKNKILFEASGGINEENIEEYSKTGVDIISLGFITHSPKVLNMSLEVK